MSGISLCLGACDKAPVLMVGEDLHENVSVQSLQYLFADSGDGA